MVVVALVTRAAGPARVGRADGSAESTFQRADAQADGGTTTVVVGAAGAGVTGATGVPADAGVPAAAGAGGVAAGAC